MISFFSPSRQFNTLMITLLILVFIYNVTAAAAKPLTTPFVSVGVSCMPNATYTQNSTYQINLKTLLSNLTTHAATTTFLHSSAGADPNKASGLFFCREDLSPDICHSCVQTAAEKIVNGCPNEVEAVIYFPQCTLRYANRTDILVPMNVTTTVMSSAIQSSNWNASDTVKFDGLMNDTISGLIGEVVTSTTFFATKDANFTILEHLYMLAHCTPGITLDDCRNCLSIATLYMRVCCVSRLWYMFYSPNCQFRYDTASFFELSL